MTGVLGKRPPTDEPRRPRHSSLSGHGTYYWYARGGQSARRWSITFPPTTQAFMDFSRYRADGHSFRPVVWESQGGGYVNADTPYWIIRCPKEIIKGHNDIWSQQAMDTYAALYAISLALGQKKP